MLLAKLLITPLLIGCASLVARRWGAFIGGVFTGLPLVAGPITFFMYLEQGRAFALASADATLLGIAAVVAFVVVYAFCARRHWLVALLLGWTAYFITMYALSRLSLVSEMRLLLVVLWILLALRLFPRVNTRSVQIGRLSRTELGLRMLCTALLVVLVTTLSQHLGATLSGLLAVFPIATSVMAVFTQRSSGFATATYLLRGLLSSLLVLAAFYYVLVKLAVLLAFGPAFVCAVVIVLFIQAAWLGWLSRKK